MTYLARPASKCVFLFSLNLLICLAFPVAGLDSDEIRRPTYLPRSIRASGQIVRLRGGNGQRAIGEGRIELFYGGRWGLVCDDLFDLNDAHVICRQLGFFRGASLVNGQGHYGFGGLRTFALDNLQCEGHETSIFHCKRSVKSDCNHRTEAAGVQCKLNYPSKCNPGGVLFENTCYYFHFGTPTTFDNADKSCRENGGHLITIRTQEQSDFVSEVLFAKYANEFVWYTGGRLSSSGGRASSLNKWKWNAGPFPEGASTFTKWRPGYRHDGLSDCLVLKHSPDDMVERDYYYWDTSMCDRKLPYICEAPPIDDVGCVKGNGKDYDGKASVTRSGRACQQWSTVAKLPKTGSIFARQSQWNHNFCRNPDGDQHPWCMVDSTKFDLCDIPNCEKEQNLGVCEADEFRCGSSSQCVSNSFVCDYEQDCANNFDEQNCTDWLSSYVKTAGQKIEGTLAEVWTFIPHPQGCAQRCTNSESFRCRSFAYDTATSSCMLSVDAISSGIKTVAHAASDYYELVTESATTQAPCLNSHFECSNGRCISESLLCDGHDDCMDKSDENNCTHFSLRLMGGSSVAEGRLEIRVFDQWGSVCSDEFDMEDANVVCKQLGYSNGASHFSSTPSKFTGTVLPFIMSSVGCEGAETSLERCAYTSDWQSGKFPKPVKCGSGTTVDITCAQENDGTKECTSNQHRCDSGECVNLTWLCDGDKDCRDGSDENEAKCKESVAVRLVPMSEQRGKSTGGTVISGRLEVRYFGVWGTVCDDEFDDKDALVVCKMLGVVGGRAEAHVGEHQSSDKSGPIWLDGLKCDGNESSIEQCRGVLKPGFNDCQHSEDVGVTCYRDTEPLPIPDSGECGRRFVNAAARDPRKNRLRRIVGGFDAPRGAYPWTAAVRMKPDRHHCGATVVSRKHVLTAAHCFDDEPDLAEYELVIGDWDNRQEDGSEQRFQIESITRYPEYENVLKHDLAILTLKPANGSRFIQFTEYVQPICLPPLTAPYRDGMKCVVSGWGSLGVEYPRKMQAASLPIMARDKCVHPSVYGKIMSEHAFCAGFLRGGIDSCQGDSGGPFSCHIDGKFFLYGVISWGDGCAERDKPGIYTRVTDYLTWIDDEIKR